MREMRQLLIPSREYINYQQISGPWLRAARIGKFRPSQGRIPIRPVLPAEPDLFACRDVRRNQSIHGVPANLRELRIRAKNQYGVACSGNDYRKGRDASDPERHALQQPEA